MLSHDVDPEAAEHQAMAARHDAMLRASPAYFASHMIQAPAKAPFFGKFLIGHHHLEWDELVMGPKKACVLASRNLGKSYYFSLAVPLFFASYQPNAITLVLSSTDETASRLMEEITQQLEDNPRFAHLLPKRRLMGRWNSSQKKLANGHVLHIAGMGKRLRGLHPDNIIGDDLLSDEAAYSETVRQRTESYFMGAITPMLNPLGKMMVVGTPQSARDLLMGNLRRNPAYIFRVYPGEVDGTPMWATKLSREHLAAAKLEMGSVRYAREILCRPVADTSSLFNIKLFQDEPVEQFGLTCGLPREHWIDSGMTLYMGVDIALSSEIGSDYCVVVVVAVDTQGNHWFVDMHRERGLTLEQQKSVVMRLGYKYRPSALTIETNQAQVWLYQQLKSTTDLAVVPHVTTSGKHSLVNGLPSLKILFENRKLRLPRGDAASQRKTDILIDEFNNFTFLGGKVVSVGQHDDVAMAYWICVEGMKKQTFSVSFGEETVVQSGQPVPETALERAQNQPQTQPQLPGSYNPFGF